MVEALEDRCLLSANQAFLFQTYEDLLHRPIDSSGADFWSGQLDQGVTRSQVALSIQTSPEFLVQTIEGIYGTYLKRLADPDGGNFFANLLFGGTTIEQIKADIIGSAEYFQNQAGGTNDGFVVSLYQNLFNRSADGSGEAFWDQALAHGTSRTQVALSFLLSAEGESNLVQGFYKRLLHRTASAAEVNGFVSQLQQGVTDQQVVAGFIGSAEYYAVSNAPVTHFGFVLPSGSGPAAGTTFSFAVAPLNQYGNLVSGYTGTVHFTSSDTSATLPADYTFVPDDNAVHLFSNGATVFKAGPQTLTATDSVDNTITGTSASFTVTPDAATQFQVSAPATVTAGTSFTVTVTALDQFNNVATSYTGPYHFLSTDTSVTLPLDSNFAATDNGVKTFSMTLTTAETLHLGVEDANPPTISGITGVITVQNAPASHFQVTGPAGATAGQSFSFTVTAQDPFGNAAVDYAGTVKFSSSDTTGSLPGNSTFKASDMGVQTLSATFTLAGSPTITATQTGSGPTVTGTSSSIAISAAAATQLTVSVPSTASAGTAVDVTVTARDPFGNVDTGYGGTVTFTSSDNAANLPADYPFVTGDQGSHTFTGGVIFNTTGPQTVTAQDLAQPSSIFGTSNTATVS
jgi:hypothetical protein